MPTRKIELTDHFDNLIATGIASGRFSDANEVVGEALRLLEERNEEHRAKVEWLRSAAEEGFGALDRGEYVEFNSREELATFVKGLHDEVAAEFMANRD